MNKHNIFYILLVIIFSCSPDSSDDFGIIGPTIKKTTLENEPNIQGIVASLNYSSIKTQAAQDTQSPFSLADWSSIIQYYDDQKEINFYTVPINDNKNRKRYVENLVLSGSKSSPKAHIVRYEPIEGWLDQYSLSRNFDQFEGKVYYLTLDGAVFKETAFSLGPNGIDQRGTIAQDCITEDVEYLSIECVSGVCDGDWTCNFYITTRQETSCYPDLFIGGGGDGGNPGGGGPGGDPSGGGSSGDGDGNGGDGESILVPLDNTLPCAGDPVPVAYIAYQRKKSGILGGMFGCTRYANSCSLSTGTNVAGRKKHAGIDIANAFGRPVYAMYSGTATKHYQEDGAGYYVTVSSVINGQSRTISYFHLQDQGRATGQVQVGDIIGIQGDSGNLKDAIEDGYSISHVHIKVKDENGTPIDPRDYMNSKFLDDGTPDFNNQICN